MKDRAKTSTEGPVDISVDRVTGAEKARPRREQSQAPDSSAVNISCHVAIAIRRGSGNKHGKQAAGGDSGTCSGTASRSLSSNCGSDCAPESAVIEPELKPVSAIHFH